MFMQESGARLGLVLLLSAGLLTGGLLLAHADGPAPKQDAAAKEIQQLIAQLGDARYDARRKATQRLLAIGGPALDALRQAAASSKDAEVRWRAKSLVEKIEAARPAPRSEPKVDPIPRVTPRGPNMPQLPPGQLPDALRQMMEQLRRQMQAPGGGGGNAFRFNNNGRTRLSVTENGTRYDFDRKADGSLGVVVTKGSDKKTHAFKNEAEMKAKAPALHAIWKRSANFRINVLPFGGGGQGQNPLNDPRFRRLLEQPFRDMFRGQEDVLRQLQQSMERLRQLQQLLDPNRQPGQPNDAMRRMQQQLEALRRLQGQKAPSKDPRVAKPVGLRHGLVAKPVPEALRAQLKLEAAVLIDAVDGGLAAKLGLRQYDLVTHVNGAAVATAAALHAALDKAPRGPLSVSVVRSGDRTTLSLPAPAKKK